MTINRSLVNVSDQEREGPRHSLDDAVCCVLGRDSYSIQHGDEQETGKDR